MPKTCQCKDLKYRICAIEEEVIMMKKEIDKIREYLYKVDYSTVSKTHVSRPEDK